MLCLGARTRAAGANTKLVDTVMLVPQKIGGSRKDARTGCTKYLSGMGAEDEGAGVVCCTSMEVMKCDERCE